MRIAIFAGLGNQLFQFALAHEFSKINGERIELAIDNNPQIDRDYALDPVLTSCGHVKSLRKTNIREMKGYAKLGKFSRFLSGSKLRFVSNALPIAYELNPYVFDPNQCSRDRLNVGYYQNWKYVENSWPEIGQEILNAVAMFNKNLPSLENSEYLATIHIRRGDLLQSVSTMGVLSEDYYLRIVRKLRESEPTVRIVCITDDLENSSGLINKLEPDWFFGPGELGTWESLALMARSKVVVAANSTFSWWGAYICFKMGGNAILPNPWFKNWHQDIGDAFYFPGCTTEVSNFLEGAK